MAFYFISDLHLGEDQRLLNLFDHFLTLAKPDLEALFILGDLFELWRGDDLMDSAQQRVVDQLRAVSAKKIPIYFLKGNRDFLIGHQFLQEAGCILLNEPAVLIIGGKRIVMCHGDTLCLSDRPYQRFRKVVRNRWLQNLFNKLPQRWRGFITTFLKQSTSTTRQIIDISPETLAPLQRAYEADVILHGHTHLPAIHLFEWPAPPQHIVLSDWNETGHYLKVTADGVMHSLFFTNPAEAASLPQNRP